MNEAKMRERLETWWPDDDHEEDASLRAALAAAERSPHLQRWLERRVRIDQQLAQSAASIALPAGERDALVQRMQTAARQRVHLLRVTQWAALFLLLLSVAVGGWWRWGNSSQLNGAGVDALVEETLRYSQRIPRLEYRHREVAELKAWLAQSGFDVPDDLPDWVNSLPSKGCRLLDFSGQPVALICFRGERTYHLYIARRPVAGDERLPLVPRAQASDGWSMAIWADERFVYVLNADAPFALGEAWAAASRRTPIAGVSSGKT